MRFPGGEAGILTDGDATPAGDTGRIDGALERWLLENIDTQGRLLGAGYQAEVFAITTPAGTRIAVKRPRHGALAGVLARAAIRREHAAYARLAGTDGVPRVYGLTNRDWLAIEFVAGRSLREAQHELDDREKFFGLLLGTVSAMHASGVAHGDLKRKDNVIVTPDGRPFLIDFGIARIRGRSTIDDFLFDFTKQLDLNAWIKLKYGRRPAAMTAADAALYRPQRVERIARWVRIPWQQLTLRRPRQRLRRWLAARKRQR